MSRDRRREAEAASFYARTTAVQGDGHCEEQDNWVEMLRVDITFARALPSHPLGVLCYAMYCIIGVQGHLSTQKNSAEPRSAEMEQILPLRYYYHEQEDGETPCPIPPQALAEREMTSSSERTPAFANQLKQRERTCVITNTSPTQACHLIPHSKGNATIQILGHYRGKDPALHVSAIDDVRNGLRLSNLLHHGLATQQFCFLPLPNYMMPLTPDQDGRRFLSNSSIRVKLRDFSKDRPMSLLITAPRLEDGIARFLLDEGMGTVCYLYPGRKTSSAWNPPLRDPASSEAGEEGINDPEEESATTSQEPAQIDQPEIWILDVVLAACFLKWFGTEEGRQYVKDVSQGCLSDIETAINREKSDQKKTRGARSPSIGAKRTASPTGASGQSSKRSRTAKGYQSTSLWDGDLAEQCLRIAMAFPSREAVQNQYKYRQEQLDLQQTSVERLSSWIEGQGNRRRDTS